MVSSPAAIWALGGYRAHKKRHSAQKIWHYPGKVVAPTSQLSGLIPGHKWNLSQSSPKHQKQGKVWGSDTANAEERVVASPIQLTHSVSHLSSPQSWKASFIHNSQFTDDKAIPCSNVSVTVWLIPPQL